MSGPDALKVLLDTARAYLEINGDDGILDDDVKREIQDAIDILDK